MMHKDTLESLDLADSKLQANHIVALSECVKNCDGLLSLNLTDNIIRGSNEYSSLFVSNI